MLSAFCRLMSVVCATTSTLLLLFLKFRAATGGEDRPLVDFVSQVVNKSWLVDTTTGDGGRESEFVVISWEGEMGLCHWLVSTGSDWLGLSEGEGFSVMGCSDGEASVDASLWLLLSDCKSFSLFPSCSPPSSSTVADLTEGKLSLPWFSPSLAFVGSSSSSSSSSPEQNNKLLNPPTNIFFLGTLLSHSSWCIQILCWLRWVFVVYFLISTNTYTWTGLTGIDSLSGHLPVWRVCNLHFFYKSFTFVHF